MKDVNPVTEPLEVIEDVTQDDNLDVVSVTELLEEFQNKVP